MRKRPSRADRVRGGVRRPSPGPIERLEARDLMAFVVGPVLAVEDQSFQGKVATFAASDVAGSEASAATIAWGDGTTTPGSIAANGTGGFDVIGIKTYGRPSRYQVTVTLVGSDADKTRTSAQGEASVTEADLSLVATPFTAITGRAFNGTLATFQDFGGTADDYRATIRWGEGEATTPATVTAGANGGFAVGGTYTYRDPGAEDATVSIVRISTGQVADAVSQGTIVSSALNASGTVIAASAGALISGVPVASFSDLDAGTTGADYFATVAWGPGLPTTVGTIEAVAGSAGQFIVRGSFTYSAAGTQQVTVTITRRLTGQVVTATTAAIVQPVADVVAPLLGSGFPITTTAGQPFSGPLASFADPASASNQDPGVFSAAISWGDGTTTPATVAYDSTARKFLVFGSKTFATPGVFGVRVTVVRKDSGTDYALDTTATAYAFAGGLDPLTDLGSSNSDGITGDHQPRFLGTVEPLALVRLFARRADASSPFPIGETIAGSDGRWALTSPPLDDGTYAITGVVLPTAGSPYPEAAITTVRIDTVAPRALGVAYNPKTGIATATFRDDRSGIDPARLDVGRVFSLAGPRGPSKLKGTPVVSTPSADSRTVIVTFRVAPGHRKGKHVLRVAAGGLIDRAGNALAQKTLPVRVSSMARRPIITPRVD
ncbi:Ig-like domain-containing protein [Tundrisphaera sp. TA3]|uniref:Ig-like domain-containing protein n=1 Tax=Tundrisphaera sp. TA3 TaxID=3435775 RepID=UPI003EB8B0DD